ncbi:23S rRNA (adenine(2503)-C(2))-methyltransferase RlmN [Desulfonema ishimotonii]|uniref:23S rRNA (Adenine(2503)-C(2))-methyltransferase RlmN n=1 Tax=Desulfonema ishimotonii TaxID=45657 RepID=A0A401G2C5_9BACT|nr:23S rRNA (adenine(2503)-C(2))-methyltransferase RlmN [Desulfonema ishimotonii]GBC63311.1 23S rRNA (adenine(2503)-C(2))-methyltransferase RlmN [Desulfonema ishimotonii]
MTERSTPLNPLSLTFGEFADRFRREYGKGHDQAAAAYREFFRNSPPDFSAPKAFANMSELARKLAADLCPGLPELVTETREGALCKWGLRLGDGLMIESVVVPMTNHVTLCISSQAGCRMGCAFCETARMGLRRNLTAAEIVGQVFTAKVVRGLNIRNIVFMGMGEPLDNFDNVVQAIRVMNDDRGLAIAHRHITLSTAGRADGIRKLAALGWPNLHLAVSLNAPDDRIRSALMPVNRKYPMAALRDALSAWPLKKNGTLFVEYVLIRDVNDRPEHARQVAEYLRPLKVRLNLIPYNPRSESPFDPPSEAGVLQFRDWLVRERVFVRLRTAKGRDIMAGCGQLAGRTLSDV